MQALRYAAFLVQIAFLSPSQAVAGTDPVTYHLSGDSNYIQGCFDPCLCPLVYLGPLEGTFDLAFESSTPDGFEHYSITGVDWKLTLVLDTEITGSGTYSRGPGFHRLQLALSIDGEPLRDFDSDLVPGGDGFPLLEASVNEHDLVCYDTVFNVLAAPLAAPASSFCNGNDGSLASCPCGNAGNPDSGCDLPQATGGVRLDAVSQTLAPNGATLRAEGFPPAASPAAIVIRSGSLDPASPVVFGDGLRCVGSTYLTRLAAAQASGGVSEHSFGHGAMAGSGTFYYQLWFRSTPISFCDATAAYNLSNGQTLSWP